VSLPKSPNQTGWTNEDLRAVLEPWNKSFAGETAIVYLRHTPSRRMRKGRGKCIGGFRGLHAVAEIEYEGGWSCTECGRGPELWKIFVHFWLLYCLLKYNTTDPCSRLPDCERHTVCKCCSALIPGVVCNSSANRRSLPCARTLIAALRLIGVHFRH
jgi:hypothetical protein